MFKQSWEYFKHVTNSKWKILALIFVILIPLIYTGFLIGAFWSPIANMGNLKVTIVNNDQTFVSQKIEDAFKNAGNKTIGTSNYKFNIETEGIYSEDNVKKQIENGHWAASFVIPKGYEEKLMLYTMDKVIQDQGNDPLIQALINKIKSTLNIPDQKYFPKLDFYNSYKQNYLSAEMTSLAAQLNSWIIDAGQFNANDINKILDKIDPNNTLTQAEKLKISLELLNIIQNNNIFNNLNKSVDNIVHNNRIGFDIKNYGKGLTPYFISMSMWAGCLVMTFLLHNKRGKKELKKSTISCYLSKSVIWIAIAWVQTLLMFIVITLIGVRWDANPWIVLCYSLIISTIFALIVQGLAYTFRFAELGSFIVIILLIFQLASSSGTFPSETQNGLFQALHPYVPFTYTIISYRDFFGHPNISNAFAEIWHIAVFLAIVPIALLTNYLFDRRTFKKDKEYKSFHLDFEDE